MLFSLHVGNNSIPLHAGTSSLVKAVAGLSQDSEGKHNNDKDIVWQRVSTETKQHVGESVFKFVTLIITSNNHNTNLKLGATPGEEQYYYRV